MLNLESEHLETIQDILKKQAPTMTVWAYGSRVQGKAHQGSDLDLVILNPNDPTKPQQNLMVLRTALSESNLPIQVEILDWATTPIAFQKEIKKKYIEIYPNFR